MIKPLAMAFLKKRWDDWEVCGDRHHEGKHDRHQKGKHRSTSLRVALMPPQGDKDAYGGPLCSNPSAASRRSDHPRDCRTTAPFSQDHSQGAAKPRTDVGQSLVTAD